MMDDHTLPVLLWPLDEGQVVAFGSPRDLDLLGSQTAEVPHPFVAAIRQATAAAPQLQHAADLLTGRVVQLTAESAKLLSQHQSVTKGGLMTGVVRGGDGKFAGLLTFVHPGSGVAALAGQLPAIAGGIALQLQLARIEKALDGIKHDLGYLIREKHLELESGIETVLAILSDVYGTLQRRGTVEDDEWDRIAISEPRVRDLHGLTRKNVRALSAALEEESAPLPVRLAKLNRALGDERAELWVRAHVHAELALTRWECLYLVRTADLHPEELALLTDRTRSAVEGRRSELVELHRRITEYLQDGGQVTGLVDRLRFISRMKLQRLLTELEQLLDVYERELGSTGTPLPEEVSSLASPVSNEDDSPSRRKQLMGRMKALPAGVRPAWDEIAEKIPASVKRRP
jgi:hypothetical protein